MAINTLDGYTEVLLMRSQVAHVTDETVYSTVTKFRIL